MPSWFHCVVSQVFGFLFFFFCFSCLMKLKKKGLPLDANCRELPYFHFLFSRFVTFFLSWDYLSVIINTDRRSRKVADVFRLALKVWCWLASSKRCICKDQRGSKKNCCSCCFFRFGHVLTFSLWVHWSYSCVLWDLLTCILMNSIICASFFTCLRYSNLVTWT